MPDQPNPSKNKQGGSLATEDNPGVYDQRGNEPTEPISGQTDLGEAEGNPDSDQATSADEGEDRQVQGLNNKRVGSQNDRDFELRVRSKVWKRRWVSIAIILGILTGGGGGTVFFLKGPLELLQLGSLLSRFSGHMTRSVRLRYDNFTRAGRALQTGDIAETRVTKVGSEIFHRAETKLGEKGVRFDRTDPRTGRLGDTLRGIEIEAAKHPEFSQYPLERRAQAIADHYGIPVDQVHQISGLDGGKFRIQTGDARVRDLRLLVDTSLRNVEDGRVLSFLNKRTFIKFFDLPSLFHPIKRAARGVRNRLATRAIRRAFEEERRAGREGSLKENLREKYRSAKENVRSAVEPHSRAINRALLITAVACEARALAHEIPAFNFAAVVGPSIVASTGFEAIKSQLQSGSPDLSLDALGAVSESLVDSDGKSVWGAKSLNALAYNGPGEGIDIRDGYKQAFSNNTTTAAILDTLGNNGVTEAACSGPGQVVQVFISLALIALGPGGWQVKAAQVGVESVATIAFINFAQTLILDQLTEDPVTSFAGAQGGNLLAYGARAGEGTNDRRMGGVALEDTNDKITLKEVEEEERKEFQQKNLFARMFDLTDYRSLAASAVRSSDTSPVQGISSFAANLANGSLLSKFFSMFIPSAHAQAEESYDWDTPLYGIPTDILEDPKYQDPYENAETVARLLNASEGESMGVNTDGGPQVLDNHTVGDQVRRYRERVKECFGLEFFKDADGWAVSPVESTNPTEEGYVDADCAHLEDENWVRLILFIFDTNLVIATQCFGGDQAACQLMIFGRPRTEEGTTPIGPSNCPTAPAPHEQIVSVQGVEVHRCIADQVGRLLTAAHADGVNLSGWGWRNPQEQIELRRQHCGDSHYDIYEKSSSECNPPTARPGRSQHEFGLAIDFTLNGHTIDHGDAGWNWLVAHAGEYGLINLPEESWHWSTTGR